MIIFYCFPGLWTKSFACCLWRNILKIIIIEISLKWMKFRGYLSVFSCIFSTVWLKFLPLGSGTQSAASALCSAVQSAYTSSYPFVLGVNGCVYFYSLQYFCSQTSKKAKIRLTNCICCNIIWHVLFVKWT